MGTSVRQFEPKKDRGITPDDLDRLPFVEVRRLVSHRVRHTRITLPGRSPSTGQRQRKPCAARGCERIAYDGPLCAVCKQLKDDGMEIVWSGGLHSLLFPGSSDCTHCCTRVFKQGELSPTVVRPLARHGNFQPTSKSATTQKMVASGEPLFEEVRQRFTELRTDFVRQFEPTMSRENSGIDAFVALIQQEIDWVMTRLRSNPLVGNLLLATDEGASDESRMQGFQEGKRLTNAEIVPQRWHLTDPQLIEMAKRKGCSPKKVAEENILSAIQLAIEAVDELTVDDVAAIGAMIRTRVNDIVTEAVLGPRWRDYKNHISLIEIRDGDSYAAAAESGLLKEAERHGSKLVAQINTSEIEAPIILRQMMKRAKLSPGEARAVEKMLKEDSEPSAADAKGTETSTRRVQRQRAINKMRKIKK